MGSALSGWFSLQRQYFQFFESTGRIMRLCRMRFFGWHALIYIIWGANLREAYCCIGEIQQVPKWPPQSPFPFRSFNHSLQIASLKKQDRYHPSGYTMMFILSALGIDRARQPIQHIQHLSSVHIYSCT